MSVDIRIDPSSFPDSEEVFKDRPIGFRFSHELGDEFIEKVNQGDTNSQARHGHHTTHPQDG